MPYLMPYPGLPAGMGNPITVFACAWPVIMAD